MRAPWAGVPAPGGKPVPSGWMLISHAAMSAASTGLPRLGPSPAAALPAKESASQTTGMIPLCVGMLDPPGAVDRPAGDGIEVLVRKRRNRRNCLQLAAFGDKFGAGWLDIAGLVPGATLQDCGTAVPAPWHAEAGEGLAQHRLLQGRLGPASAAIGRNHHLGDPPGAGIGDAGDLVETGLLQCQPRRGLS